MSTSSGSARPSGSFGFRWPGHPDPNLRLSDADRAEVADRLAKHYGDGRLDQAEFDARLDRAMSAKTHGDLTGLFADLPPSAEPPPQAVPVPRRPRMRPFGSNRLLTIVLLVVVVLVASRVAAHLLQPWFWFGSFFWFGPWLWIALAVFLWLRFGPRHHGNR